MANISINVPSGALRCVGLAPQGPQNALGVVFSMRLMPALTPEQEERQNGIAELMLVGYIPECIKKVFPASRLACPTLNRSPRAPVLLSENRSWQSPS